VGRLDAAHPAVTAPIMGARTLAALEDNLGALDVTLTADQRARIEEASDIELGFPHEFLARPLTASHVRGVKMRAERDARQSTHAKTQRTTEGPTMRGLPINPYCVPHRAGERDQAALPRLGLMSDSAGMPSPSCGARSLQRKRSFRLRTSCTRFRLPMYGIRSRGCSAFCPC